MKGKKTEGREQPAACQRSRLRAVLHWENGRKFSPPNSHPRRHHPPQFGLSSSHTLLRFPGGPGSTAGLIKPRERQRDRKKEKAGERKRGHTTGRHQSKPCMLSFFQPVFFPFISHFMIEFLTNTLAVHWVQTHSKKLLFDSASLGTLLNSETNSGKLKTVRLLSCFAPLESLTAAVAPPSRAARGCLIQFV